MLFVLSTTSHRSEPGLAQTESRPILCLVLLIGPGAYFLTQQSYFGIKRGVKWSCVPHSIWAWDNFIYRKDREMIHYLPNFANIRSWGEEASMSRPSHLPTSHKEVYSISMELMIGPKLGISLHKEKVGVQTLPWLWWKKAWRSLSFYTITNLKQGRSTAGSPWSWSSFPGPLLYTFRSIARRDDEPVPRRTHFEAGSPTESTGQSKESASIRNSWAKPQTWNYDM